MNWFQYCNLSVSNLLKQSHTILVSTTNLQLQSIVLSVQNTHNLKDILFPILCVNLILRFKADSSQNFYSKITISVYDNILSE